MTAYGWKPFKWTTQRNIKKYMWKKTQKKNLEEIHIFSGFYHKTSTKREKKVPVVGRAHI